MINKKTADNSPNIKTRLYNQKKLSAQNHSTVKNSPAPRDKKVFKLTENKNGLIVPDSNNEQKSQLLLETLSNENEKLKADLKSMEAIIQETRNEWMLHNNVLGATSWLTDDVLQMYFDIVSTKLVHSSLKLLILNPAVCNAFKFRPLNDLDSLLDPFLLKEKEYIIMAINNSVETNEEGGSHWSLLVYRKCSSNVVYYDSSKTNMNLEAARKTSLKLANYLNVSAGFDLVQLSGPKQNNGFDCGIYIVFALEWIIQKIINSEYDSISPIPESNYLDCVLKRASIAYVINNRFRIPAETFKELIIHPSQNKPPMVPVHNVRNQEKTNDRDSKIKKLQIETAIQTDISSFCPINNQLLAPYTIEKIVDSTYQKVRPIINKKPIVNINKFPKNLTDLKAAHLNKLKRKKIGSKIAIVSDSHGRGLSEIINNRCSEEVEVCGLVSPGATFSQVLSKIDPELYTDKDYVVLIGGSNDVPLEASSAQNFYENLSLHLDRLKSTNIILCTLPYRHDHDVQHDIHNKVLTINRYITDLASQHEHIKILDLYMIERHHHSKHGQHFNRRGKLSIAGLILKTIHNAKTMDVGQPSKPFQSNNIPHTPVSNNFQGIGNLNDHIMYKDSKTNKMNPEQYLNNIMISEMKMSDKFDQHQGEKDTAFSHCISADVTSHKNMSAGVAVAFKKRFGRPLASDFIASHLTCQKDHNLNLVYGMVTKAQYFQKPTIEDYNLSFRQMTEDFLKKKLKKLICPPMGCNRDKIPLEHFAACIVQFQLVTGASVDIVASDQQSHRLPCHGLTHSDFVARMHQLISEQQSMLIRTPQKKMSTSEQPSTPPLCPEGTDSSVSARVSHVFLNTPDSRDVSMMSESSPWLGWPSPKVSPSLPTTTESLQTTSSVCDSGKVNGQYSETSQTDILKHTSATELSYQTKTASDCSQNVESSLSLDLNFLN